MKMNQKFLNSAKGQVFYGMHFYPGVAQYDQAGQDPLVVYLNEKTIREMGPTFAGCPIYVQHVDDVADSIDQVNENGVDGWVLESFFNESDGKHWVKFVVVSEKGLGAIQNGYRLSNAYIAQGYGDGGVWNGVSYQKEVVRGEFEHLAIVQDPRYEESVIMTPEEFKHHNEEKRVELLRLANSKTKGDTKMALKFWKRAKVENSTDFDEIVVELPKSKKEMVLSKLVNDHDAYLNMAGYASGEHMVKVGENEMSVNDLVKAHMAKCNEMDEAKKKNAESEDGGEPGGDEDDMDNDTEAETIAAGHKDVGTRGGDESLENAEDDEKDEKEEKKKNAKEKAARLKNAHKVAKEEIATVSLSFDGVARGKARYGSN